MIRLFIPVSLILIAVTPLAAFFQPGLPYGHDAQDHVVRIANFYKALSDGVLVPRWAGNLNWGYGHPVIMFLYPLSSYLASFFHGIGFSFVDATKAVFVFAYIASILTMYVWVSTAWGKRAGIIGALLYGFAPYRFVDMYVRMAIGEHMAFIFPPLICYFLYKLATQEKSMRFEFGLTVSIALLILSHNALALMFLPVIGLYVVYLTLNESKSSFFFILYALFGILTGFGLSSFFWVPALLEGKYTLRDIVTTGEALDRFVPWTWFFYSPWNYGGTATLTKSVGIPQWMGIAASLVVIFKTKEKKLRSLISVFFFLFFASLFIMTSASEAIWMNVKLLQNFQFPWRFLSVSIFIGAVIGGISVSSVINSTDKLRIRNTLFIAYCLLLIASTFPMWHPKEYQIKDESFYTGMYAGTTDTGESSPIWTTRFMEQAPKAVIEVISGEATVQPVRRTTIVHEYQIIASTRAELLENTLYFPGWEVSVDGKKTDIEFQSGLHRGIITFWVDEGTHRVKIEFRDTKIRRWANSISIVSIMMLPLGSWFLFLLWKRRK